MADLDGDGAAKPRVASFIDLSHAALTEQPLDPIRTELLAARDLGQWLRTGCDLVGHLAHDTRECLDGGRAHILPGWQPAVSSSQPTL
jgi:hypothetical protein